jgi:hypothetical protein
LSALRASSSCHRHGLLGFCTEGSSVSIFDNEEFLGRRTDEQLIKGVHKHGSSASKATLISKPSKLRSSALECVVYAGLYTAPPYPATARTSSTRVLE